LQLEQLTQEFTVRIGALESKLRDACHDRDSYRVKFEQVLATWRWPSPPSQPNRLSPACWHGLWQVTTSHTTVAKETERMTAQVLREKEEQIEALRTEGAKIAEKQFRSANINKKLQAKNQVGCVCARTHTHTPGCHHPRPLRPTRASVGCQEAEEKLASLSKQLASAEVKLASVEAQLAEKTAAEKQYLKVGVGMALVMPAPRRAAPLFSRRRRRARRPRKSPP
jgi:DNA repair exonuclease SbcCD ATPase subunit